MAIKKNWFPHFTVQVENTRGHADPTVVFASADLDEAGRVFDAQQPPRGKSIRLRDFRDDMGWTVDEKRFIDHAAVAAEVAEALAQEEREAGR